ncbi:MFS transporter [Phenylobacterium ferrooxidans]|uniref:MFS transporter n=1 Tax=Phenylobacterium ferrooxidans TaxID=2982689 RepID=A0ABW6CTX8_9CAUL
MAFLRNDAINRVNLHSGVQALAQGAGSIFFFVLLLKAGVSVPHALLAQAAIVTARFVLRPLVLPLAIRFGLKPLLIAGTLMLALRFPLLAEVGGIDLALIALLAVTAVAELTYWLAYNTYFAMLGDDEHRGHQVAAREAFIAVLSIASPLLGTWALLTLGPRWAFAGIAVVQALAALPLLGLPNMSVVAQAPGALRAAKLAFALLVIDGWFDACYFFVWEIGLFLSLGESIAAYGGAMALAGLVGASFGLWVGRHVDGGGGRRTVLIAYSVAVAIVTLRAGALPTPWLAVIAHALGAVLMPLLLPPLGAAAYTLAKASPCPFRFHMVTEGGWDIGCAGACVTAAALITLGAPLSVPILLALPAVAAGFTLLWRYFGRLAAA